MPGSSRSTCCQGIQGLELVLIRWVLRQFSSGMDAFSPKCRFPVSAPLPQGHSLCPVWYKNPGHHFTFPASSSLNERQLKQVLCPHLRAFKVIFVSAPIPDFTVPQNTVPPRSVGIMSSVVELDMSVEGNRLFQRRRSKHTMLKFFFSGTWCNHISAIFFSQRLEPVPPNSQVAVC